MIRVPFLLTAGNFCSRRCQADASRRTVTLVCPGCTIQFAVQPSRLEATRGDIYCSMACRQSATGSVTLACHSCGNEFATHRYRLALGEGKFCSTRCYGQSLIGQMQEDPAARFWRYVNKTETCWIWTGTIIRNGYGAFSIGSRRILAHRFAWSLVAGDIPAPTRPICHNCPGGDNRRCVRNDDLGTYEVNGVTYERRGHLWLGTPAANTADAINKGTLRPSEFSKMGVLAQYGHR